MTCFLIDYTSTWGDNLHPIWRYLVNNTDSQCISFQEIESIFISLSDWFFTLGDKRIVSHVLRKCKIFMSISLLRCIRWPLVNCWISDNLFSNCSIRPSVIYAKVRLLCSHIKHSIPGDIADWCKADKLLLLFLHMAEVIIFMLLQTVYCFDRLLKAIIKLIFVDSSCDSDILYRTFEDHGV